MYGIQNFQVSQFPFPEPEKSTSSIPRRVYTFKSNYLGLIDISMWGIHYYKFHFLSPSFQVFSHALQISNDNVIFSYILMNEKLSNNIFLAF